MTVPALTDPTRAPTYGNSAFQRWLEAHLVDPRDAVFARLALRNVLVLVPLFVLLYLRFSWWLALIVWAVQLGWMSPPTILMLHCTMHRPFFNEPKWLNRTIPFVMSLLFGIPTGYAEHHVGMHHAENNLRADLSSTMGYQRDSFIGYAGYMARFVFFIHLDLLNYFTKKRRPSMARRALLTDLAHVGVMVALSFVNWQATLVAFVVPYIFMRFAMLVGNWGQHAFIDPSKPGDSYANSVTFINVGYNQRCFNDGYHIGHHVKQTRHWTEMPQDFLENLDRYAREGAIVFEGLDNFMCSMLLFAKRYDILAKKFVRLPGDERTDEQVIEFLKSRTRRIAEDVPEGIVMNA